MSNSEAGALSSPGPIVYRLAQPSELHQAASLILSTAKHQASNSQVSEFVQFASQRKIDVNTIWVACLGNRMLWAVMPMVSPGRTMILFAPSHLNESNVEAAATLTERICRHFALRDVHLAQVLVDPEHIDALPMFTQLDFVEIAELIYLQVPVHRASKPPMLKPGMGWITYSPATHALFASAILESYRDSLDCPLLSGLRNIEDVIDGHKATGEFDPLMWHLLMDTDRPVGILLLSRVPHADSVELVYLGVPQSARGRGHGNLLMQQAMRRILDDGRRRLTLAVDSKNAPAQRLYYGFGMHRIASRIALIRDLRPLSSRAD